MKQICVTFFCIFFIHFAHTHTFPCIMWVYAVFAFLTVRMHFGKLWKIAAKMYLCVCVSHFDYAHLSLNFEYYYKLCVNFVGRFFVVIVLFGMVLWNWTKPSFPLTKIYEKLVNFNNNINNNTLLLYFSIIIIISL